MRSGRLLLPATPEERYELGAEVARGGMGAVLEAEDRTLHRRVALKVMLQKAGVPADGMQRFVSEARVTGQLEHPGIVPVYELGVDAAGRVFYSMKLVRGDTLRTILKRLRSGEDAALASYPLNALLTIFLKVCDAVAFAHSRGVVHRDLKPDNIMVGEFGEVLVMDWGLAKVVGAGADEVEAAVESAPADARESGEPSGGNGGSRAGINTALADILREGEAPMLTLEGQILGTPAFMAPEQAKGAVSAIDARTDIYSLGAILYQILVLRPPVQGRSAYEILDKVVQGNVISPATRSRTAVRSRSRGAPDPAAHAEEAKDGGAEERMSFPHCPGGRVPEPLSQIVMKAMSLAPEDRYQVVPELQADIEAWRGGFATSVEAAGLWRQVTLLVRRHRVVASASLAVVLALTVGLAAALVQWRRAVASERQARQNEQRALTAEASRRQAALSAAKRFAGQAVRAAETGRWDEAERRAQDAQTVSPDGPWGSYARGMFATIRKDYPSAAEHFRAALEAAPDHAESAAGLAEALAHEGKVGEALTLATGAVDVSDWRTLLKAGRILYESNRLRECQRPLEGALELMESEKDAGKGDRTVIAAEIHEMVDTARAKIACEGFREEIENLPPEEQIKRVQAKLNEINGAEIRLSLPTGYIQDGEWVKLCIYNQDQVHFLYPLQGLRLYEFRVQRGLLRDLSPFRGMPLKKLGFPYTKVADLGPLEGMPLTDIDCAATLVDSLEPLRGMQLRRINCYGVPVTDLEPLRGMPLEWVRVPLTDVTDFSPLVGAPIEHLDVAGTSLTDLSLFRNMPLSTLDVNRCYDLADISALKGMALRELCLDYDRIADFSPLRGLPLEVLSCSHMPVEDLSPLTGMPLTDLRCYEAAVSDLTPLKGMELTHIGFTPKNITKGMDVLREMQSLKRIFPWYSPDPNGGFTAEEFWRRYDAGEFR
jgi:serine/threonine protein kinase/tetratricopeptide (TPR) repeat protein